MISSKLYITTFFRHTSSLFKQTSRWIVNISSLLKAYIQITQKCFLSLCFVMLYMDLSKSFTKTLLELYSEICNHFFVRCINLMISFFIGFRCLMWVKRNNSLFSFLHWLNFFLSFLIFQIFKCMNSLVVDLNRNIKIITINWLDYLTRTFTK